MKKSTWLFLILTTFSILHLQFTPTKPRPHKVVIAYVFGSRKLINPDSINATQLTHINYAFVNIHNGRAVLQKPDTDAINLGRLLDLKKKNPHLKILISVGGWSWSKNFSDAALTDSSRQLFAQSAAEIVKQYQLDGIDIDWEYPGLCGDYNQFRPEDKENFTLMLKELRNAMNTLQGPDQKKYILTIAAGGFQEFLNHTEMDKAQQYLDFINIMTYDFKTGEDQSTGHHTNLYNSKHDPEGESADKAVRAFIGAGVKPDKLVMGIAFYGRAWKTAGVQKHGLGDSVRSGARGGGYTRLKDSLVNSNGYIRYWDRHAKAPYLYNSPEHVFVTYDDEQSVKAKCKYVKKNGLGGVMFWEYFGDPKGYLLEAISKNL